MYPRVCPAPSSGSNIQELPSDVPEPQACELPTGIFDPQAHAQGQRARRYNEARKAYGSHFRWQFLITLTSPPVNFWNGMSRVRNYIESVEAEAQKVFGQPDSVSAVIGYARGPHGGLAHAHLSLRIAQLDQAMAIHKGLWRGILRQSWTHGRIDVQRYDPQRGGTRYNLSAQAIEWDLGGRPHRKARRKSRGGTPR